MPRVVPNTPPPGSLLALMVCVTLVYAVVLPTGLIEYDDTWLIADNPLLRDASPRALARVWTAFDLRTRLILGAEYLPVRDTLAWFIARVAGPAPWAFHTVQLAVYLGAVALLRAWLRRVLSDLWMAELVVWLFALHPAHVSSVAWAAGLKDALALLFLAAALRVYVAARARPVTVTLLVALACLSKGISVVAPALLVGGDLLAHRRPRWPSLALAALVVVASLWVQMKVGAVVQMIAEPLGRNAMERVTSMAPTALRYLGQSFLLERPCIVRVVPVRPVNDPVALCSLAILALLPLAAWRCWRAGDRLPAAALVVFTAGLAPVSQLLVPLQNRMADRYLLVAVLGPCLLAASLLVRVSRPALRASLAAAVLLASAAMTAEHAWEFADPERLWRDALERVPESPIAPYQLAVRVEARGARAEAEGLYREVLRRDAMRSDLTPRAAVNLSRILADTGRGAEAEAMLRSVVRRFPAHPRPINNLATLLYARGETQRARALFLLLVRQFPEYARGRANYESRFGPVPGASQRPTADRWTFDPYTL